MTISRWLLVAGVSKFRRLVDLVFRNRLMLLCIFVVASLLLYILINRNTYPEMDDGPCFHVFGHQLQKYVNEIDQFDTVAYYFPHNTLPGHSDTLPFVGNGHLGVALGISSYQRTLLVRHPKEPYLVNTFINPVYKFDFRRSYSSVSGAMVTRFKHGLVEEHSCYEIEGHCIRLHIVYYVSRHRPNVFVQQVRFFNPTHEEATFSVSLEGYPFVKDANKSLIDKSHCPVGNCFAYHCKVTQMSLSLTLSMNQPPNVITIQPNKFYQQHYITVVTVHDSDNFGTDEIAKSAAQLSESITLAEKGLYDEHVRTWNQLWSSGFSIAHSRAPNSLNGDSINSTIYYVLSTVPYTSDDRKEQPYDVRHQLHCYSSHSTLLNPSNLWLPITTTESLLGVMKHWRYTLVEHGCQSLVSDARNVLQAMLLSFGAFRHTIHHLQFEQQPNELHRDCQFRNIEYSHGLFVNVWVKVNNDNKVVLYVSMNKTNNDNRSLFACDAGCMDPQLQLSSTMSLIPLRQTAPPTPVLYITDEHDHFKFLKMSIHVKEVVEAPAHENHVIAMHKHGHRLGGLPTMFWFTFGFLLIVFHLFLVKLIYSEHRKGQRLPVSTYNRYSA